MLSKLNYYKSNPYYQVCNLSALRKSILCAELMESSDKQWDERMIDLLLPFGRLTKKVRKLNNLTWYLKNIDCCVGARLSCHDIFWFCTENCWGMVQICQKFWAQNNEMKICCLSWVLLRTVENTIVISSLSNLQNSSKAEIFLMVHFFILNMYILCALTRL